MLAFLKAASFALQILEKTSLINTWDYLLQAAEALIALFYG